MDETLPIKFSNEFEKEIVSLSFSTIAHLLKLGPEAFFLYVFYCYTAKKQSNEQGTATNQVRADDNLCREQLVWGQKRLSDAKSLLKKEGIIEIKLLKEQGSEKILGHVLLLNYIIPDQDRIVRTSSTENHTLDNGTTGFLASNPAQLPQKEADFVKNEKDRNDNRQVQKKRVKPVVPKSHMWQNGTTGSIYIKSNRDSSGSEETPNDNNIPVVGESLEPAKCQPRTKPCGHCARCGLFPCTELELWEIADALNIALDDVNEKYENLWEMVEGGVFQKKYPKDKTVYLTLKNWLRMAIEKGRIQKLDQFGRMDLDDQHPDKIKEYQLLKARAKERGDV